MLLAPGLRDSRMPVRLKHWRTFVTMQLSANGVAGPGRREGRRTGTENSTAAHTGTTPAPRSSAQWGRPFFSTHFVAPDWMIDRGLTGNGTTYPEGVSLQSPGFGDWSSDLSPYPGFSRQGQLYPERVAPARGPWVTDQQQSESECPHRLLWDEGGLTYFGRIRGCATLSG
jgi:hypothetical protein